MVRMTRVRLIFQLLSLTAAASLCALATTASAGERVRISSPVDPGQQAVWNQEHPGGGVYLFNAPGGYYLGRLYSGEEFDVSDTRQSRPQLNGASLTYGWGFADVAVARRCVWVGPRANASPAVYSTLTGARTAAACADIASSRVIARESFGTDFNCPIGSAQGPQQTTIAPGAAAQFHYNVNWVSNGQQLTANSFQPNPVGALTLKPGTRVRYRYSSGDKAVVFVPGLGWGFVLRSRVIPVSGAWGWEDQEWETPCGAPPQPGAATSGRLHAAMRDFLRTTDAIASGRTSVASIFAVEDSP